MNEQYDWNAIFSDAYIKSDGQGSVSDFFMLKNNGELIVHCNYNNQLFFANYSEFSYLQDISREAKTSLALYIRWRFEHDPKRQTVVDEQLKQLGVLK